MTISKKVFWVVFTLVLCALLVPASSRAILVKVEMDDMVNRAGSIIHGTVLSNQCKMAEDGTIYTFTTISVLEDLAGTHAGPEILIRNMGGRIGDKGLVVSDVPVFLPGEEVVIFVERDKKVEETDLVGWEQGKFLVADGIVERTGQPVNEFKEEVRELLTGIESD